MQIYFLPYIFIFFIALFFSIATNFIFLKTAPIIKLLDKPSKRKFQTKPMPLTGGPAIYLSFFASLFIAKIIWGQPIINFGDRFYGLFLASTVLIIIGIFDDYYNLNAYVKLFFQITAAIILIFFGYNVEVMTTPFFEMEFQLNIVLSYIMGIAWILIVMNSINLIDGVDGLAGGVIFIASATLFVLFSIRHDFFAPIMMLVLASTVLGFLFFNLPPARVYLSNSGSLFTGFLLASISLYGFQKASTMIALTIPLSILAIPLFDTFSAIIRRGRVNLFKIFKADRFHLHHRLIAIGISPRKLITVIYFCSILLGLSAILLDSIPHQYVIVFIVIFIMFVILFTKVLLFVERFLTLKILDFKRVSIREIGQGLTPYGQLCEIMTRLLDEEENVRKDFKVVLFSIDGMRRDGVSNEDIRLEMLKIANVVGKAIRGGDLVTYLGAERFVLVLYNISENINIATSRLSALFPIHLEKQKKPLKINIIDIIDASDSQKIKLILGILE
ncbi:MAG: MraY family glycosyltransferase [Pseudomonadota bacterium]